MSTTYQKVWNNNQTQIEDKKGRVRLCEGCWVYEVRVNDEYVDHFKYLREVKKAFPHAVRRGFE